MTKKHFIELADIIRFNREEFSELAIEELADFCKRMNSNFDKERWLDYINKKTKKDHE